MTLNDKIFNYIIIKDDEYILKKDTPDDVKQQIKDYQYDIKTLYGRTIVINGLN